MANYFFWAKQLNRVTLQPFWWAAWLAFIFWVPFLRIWWWLVAPLLLAIELKKLYLWWINWDYYYAKTKWHMLEIIPPKEILVPMKAMEDIFTVLWGALYNNPSWREQWCEGVMEENPDWMSFEIASIEGQLHFFIRVAAPQKNVIETALYSHYPEMEIHETTDYTKNVPQNIPNEEWDTYGEDWVLTQPPHFPIKTYEKFFEPQGEKIAAEEKRMDPLASLLELMSKLGPGEQYWMQFIITSMAPDDDAWRKAGKKEVNKLAGRPEKKEVTLIQELTQVMRNIIMGPEKEGSGEKATYKWGEVATSEEGDRELLLTPGERARLLEIEDKLKRPAFRTNMRSVYVAKRENFTSAHRLISRAYFSHFNTQHLNSFLFSKITRPKTQYVFRKRIPFIRTRRMFRNYVLRFPPLFPNRKKEMAILDPEELTTVFHFPIKITGLVLPTMARVESKKSGPPPNLPT